MRRLVISVALAMLFAAVALPTRQPVEARVSYPENLVWLGLGDSYSSGEGLRFVDAQANPPGRDCQRATGMTTVNGGQGSRAWAKVAYDTVRGQMTNSTFQLLACTGAISNEIHDQYRTEWGSAHPGVLADLLTLSMGGNNLGFADVIKRCIGIAIDNSTGAGVVLNPAIGCDTTEAEMKGKVDQLVGTSGEAPDGGQTLRDMYIELANNAVNRGGNIIVAGYPNIVEESGRWVLGLFEGNRCHRIRRADAAMLRSVTGYFNQQIALLVQEMNRTIRDVSFTWVDVSKVYETANGSRHGLCTGDPWINGITFGMFGPHDDKNPFRFDRSFHPTQDGHDQTGAEVARVVATLVWSRLDRRPDSSVAEGATGPAVVQLQDALSAAGYDLGSSDGKFGPATTAAVRAFQTDQGLQASGVVDGALLELILSVAAQAPACNSPAVQAGASALNDNWVWAENVRCAPGWAVIESYLPDTAATEHRLLRVRGAAWAEVSVSPSREVTTALAYGTPLSERRFSVLFGAVGWPGRVNSANQVADFIFNGTVNQAGTLPGAYELAAMWLDSAGLSVWNEYVQYELGNGELLPCALVPGYDGENAPTTFDGQTVWVCSYIGDDDGTFDVLIGQGLTSASMTIGGGP